MLKDYLICESFNSQDIKDISKTYDTIYKSDIKTLKKSKFIKDIDEDILDEIWDSWNMAEEEDDARKDWACVMLTYYCCKDQIIKNTGSDFFTTSRFFSKAFPKVDEYTLEEVVDWLSENTEDFDDD